VEDWYSESAVGFFHECTPMKHTIGLLLVFMCLPLGVGVISAQTKLTAGAPVDVTIGVGQKQTIEIAAGPGDIELFQLQLKGGLIAVESADAPRRVLDLGCGGRLLYAVRSSDDGVARIELTSAEQARLALVTVLDVTGARTEEERQHLRTAGIAFAQADFARRRQPGALDAPGALLAYDLAASEAEAAHDVSLARWAMTQKARYLIYQKSSFADTRSLLVRAAAMPDDNDAATQALTYKTLSSTEYYLGNLQASIDAAERSLTLYRKTGDVYWQGIVLGNLIASYGEAGRDDDAIAAGREALADSEQTKDTAGVVFSLTELGNLYREQGKYQLAFQTFRDAMAWGESIHYAPLVEAEIEKDLGLFYLDLGLWDEAQEQFELCLHNAASDGQAALDARGMLASVLEHHGDTRGALREYRSAIAIADKLHLQPEEITLLLKRSSALLRTGQTASAQKDVAEAVRLAEVLNAPTPRIDATLAKGAIQERICSSCAETTQAYGRALSLAQETGEREQEAGADAGLARAYAAHHDYTAALQSIERALSIVEHSRATLASHDLAASYFTSRHDWYSFAIEISMHLERLSPKQGYAEMSFRYAERARARAMLDAIGEGVEVASALPPSLSQQILANEHQIEDQKALLLTSADPHKTAVALHALYREEDALAAEALSKPGKLPQQGKDGIASAQDIQQMLLSPDAALLAFSPGPTHSYRWLITSASITVASLPAAEELHRRIGPLQQMLVERKPPPRVGENAEQYLSRVTEWNRVRDDALQQTGQLLIPVLPSRIRHLYIVADGSLLSLPWSALRLPCGQLTCYAVERYAISMEPSASVAVSLAQRQPKISGHDVLVVADTIASHDRPALRWAALPPLPGSRREADAIARFVPASNFYELRGERASVENVRSLAQDNIAILHFATHTILVPAHPELSGIALSSDRRNGSGVQSVLWLRDIPSFHAPPLVTLSGCTTQGQSLSGEELTTLTQAFFYAGAQQVIGSIWNVEDESTVALMEGFYSRLFVQKMEASDAMRRAQLSLLHSHAALSDWAGFVVNGVPSRSTGLRIGSK
jgi:CHAT domain-containing protein/tetratricopeptide (TPR) repeat protein